jgi:hypothetical protein
MSEPTFPFAAGDTVEDDAPAASRRRTLLALGGLGVVALGVAGYLVLSGPDDAALDLGLPTGTPAAAATPPSPTASPTAPAPATAQGRAGRDPFRAPTGTGAATAPDPTAPEPAAPEPAAPELTPPGTGAPGQAPSSPGDGILPGAGPALPIGGGPVSDGGPADQPAAAALTVSLLRVAGDQTAVLSVDGTAEPVRVGDAFGPQDALLLLSVQQGPDEGQWTAVVQQGSGDPFDVVTGHPATVV